MAKPLKKTPHKSSMSRFWNAEVVEEALNQPVESAPEPASLRVVEPVRQEIHKTETPVAVKMPQPAPTPAAKAKASVEKTPKLNVVRERMDTFDLSLTHHARQILDELVICGKQSVNRSLSATQMLRAILLALEDRMPELRAELDALGQQKMPSTESRFAAEREEFEKRLGEAIVRAVAKG